MNKLLLFLALSTLVLAAACTKAPSYPVEPFIAFKSMSKNSVSQGRAGNAPDSLNITFTFTDGDGDLGNDTTNIFFTDSRTGAREIFSIKEIPTIGAGKGVSGEITISMLNRTYFCCTFPDTRNTCLARTDYPRDTLSYAIQVVDRAGNLSNVVQTPTISILCN